jgi:energy-coupling factor transport system ATP-binding protein
VLQNCDLSLFCQSVREEIGFGPSQRGLSKSERESRTGELAECLGLETMLDDHPLSLSQGERLRTAVAAALAIGSRILLLDEPTTGQDRRQLERVMTAVTSMTGNWEPPDAVFFSTHDLATVARFADRVLVLADGRLLADCAPEELLADDGLLHAAQLRRPPLWDFRHRLKLTGRSVAELAEELRS